MNSRQRFIATYKSPRVVAIISLFFATMGGFMARDSLLWSGIFIFLAIISMVYAIDGN